ncbi:MAG TPA: extracellular solute-binding protein, partial [Anaerolineaceae bacterium]|nr:extracellular solute-binding protein [Anaerolineaceae bacterium]
AQVGDLLKSSGAPDGVLGWKILAGQSRPVIFPAASPQSLVALALYQSLDGKVVDANGRPTLDAVVLAQVYETFAEGARNGAFLPWITTLENDAQAWQAFREGRGDLLVTWSSSYLQDLPADAVAVPFNGMQSTAFTLTNGWLWAVSDPFPERRELSEKLVVFLSQSDFMSDWSEAAALLPARPSALAAWKNQSLAAMLNLVALSAHVRPDGVLLTSLGPALLESGLEVLKQKSAPLDAANQAAGRLVFPNE